MIYPGFGFGGIQPSEFPELNLTQFNALLKRFKVISSDGDDKKAGEDDGHIPFNPDTLAGMSGKQLQKALQNQIKE